MSNNARLGLLLIPLSWRRPRGCMGNFSPSQRVQDAANDLTTAAHFGRMDVAIEQVNHKTRDDYIRQHASWGTAIRIVDCDLTAMRMRDKSTPISP